MHIGSIKRRFTVVPVDEKIVGHEPKVKPPPSATPAPTPAPAREVGDEHPTATA